MDLEDSEITRGTGTVYVDTLSMMLGVDINMEKSQLIGDKSAILIGGQNMCETYECIYNNSGECNCDNDYCSHTVEINDDEDIDCDRIKE